MSLASQPAAITTQFEATAPSHLKNPIDHTNTHFQQVLSPSLALQPGHLFPSITLPNALGTPISIPALPMTFHCGSQCPFYNLALHTLQTHLPFSTSHSINLLVSPSLPDHSLSSIEKHSLQFTIRSLIRCRNILARKLEIFFPHHKEMREVFRELGCDFQKSNGDANGGICSGDVFGR